MAIEIVIGFGAFVLSLAGAGTYLLVRTISPKPEPYELGERERKLNALEEWQVDQINAAVSEEHLNEIVKLYDLRRKQIESHK